MKRFELIFAFLQLPLDYALLVLAGASAYSLRYTKFVTAIRPILFDLSWNKFYPVLLIVSLGWIIFYALVGMYSTDPNRRFATDVLRIIMASSSGFAGITIYVFFTLQKFDSRFLVLAGWIIAMIYIIAGRLFIRLIKNSCHRLGLGLRRIVIIGDEHVASIIKEHFSNEPRFGYHVEKVFATFGAAEQKQMENIIPDELIFTNPKAHEKETLRAIEFANTHHITFKYSADLFETLSSNMNVATIAGIPIIELRRTRLTGWGRIIKRFGDIVGSLLFLILTSPISILSALCILLETGRPVIYKNERVGQYGKKFLVYKFRTMFQKLSTGEQFGKNGELALRAEQELIKKQSIKTGPVYKIVNDPRITKLGRFLRRWSVDELPQFWNVLKGEMSLVGPRPHQPREVAQYEKEYSVLLAIKPGITGLAQISGRSNLTFTEEARLDTFYIENWNWYLDLIILLKTPYVIIRGKGAW
jgi:exopolysaccharide biosynthesis polyprenyl glycosylphosphotransferase